MKDPGSETAVLDRLRAVGLRPTRQRLALAKILFSQGPRHVSAEELFNEAKAHKINVSLATIYNALHDFTSKGLLRELSIDSMGSYFDTNTSEHHHFFFESSGKLEDVPLGEVDISSLPKAPRSSSISRVDVIMRLKD